MNLISTEEKIELLKNLLVDPDDWISREILSLVYRSEEDQQQRSELAEGNHWNPNISYRNPINSSFVKTNF